MKIYGVFRGFPGLGRVMSGISLLTRLRSEGYEIKAYSYLQGCDPINDENIEWIINSELDAQSVTSIGLNPIGKVGESLIQCIVKDMPDLVIIDGEPLFISTLTMVYPRERVIALLNPADLCNNELNVSSKLFFHKHYLSAGYAIVHGIDLSNYSFTGETYGCNVLSVNTILRNSVLQIERNSNGTIVAILGGGSDNASDSFVKSTVEMGKTIIEVAKLMPQSEFRLYCNDKNIAERIQYEYSSSNILIISEYTRPEMMYSDAEVVICRAGRNTISEALYLGIPALLMSTTGDFRSSEQNRNIDQVCDMFQRKLLRINKDEEAVELVKKIDELRKSNVDYTFSPGNNQAIEFINNILVK